MTAATVADLDIERLVRIGYGRPNDPVSRS